MTTRKLFRTGAPRLLKALAALVLACSALLPAPRAAAEDDPASALRIYLERQTTGLPGRAEIAVGNLDPRLNLAPCAHVEPFVPPGVRLWGKVNIGLRCLDAPGWVAYLPVEIRIWGNALVAAGALGINQGVTESDVRMEEVELTHEPGALSQPAQLTDKILLRSVAAGQVLHQDYFRQRPLLNPGDIVTLLYRGTGFTVSSEGRALSPALAGQTVRVQTASGKTLSGTAQGARLVEVQF